MPVLIFLVSKTVDTRSKIATAAEARERLGNRPSRWISGTFDPLLAEHSRRIGKLAKSGQALVVEVANSPKPLLSQRARAEHVAAIREVDYVVLADGAGTSESINDADITTSFINHVRARHAAESKT